MTAKVPSRYYFPAPHLSKPSQEDNERPNGESEETPWFPNAARHDKCHRKYEGGRNRAFWGNQTERGSILFFCNLLDLALEVLAGNEIGDVILLSVLLVLLHVLVALSELAEGSKGVGAELVKDAGDELSELLVLTVTVDGEGVGGDSGVDCWARNIVC